MADESFEAKPVGAPAAPRKGLPILRGCVGVVVLVVLAFAVGSWRASSSLDGRVAALKDQIAAVRAQPVERPVLFGPAVDGNSVDHLRAAEWILADPSGRTPSPTMVAPAMEAGHPKAHATDLLKLLGDGRDGLRRGEPLPPAIVELTKTYGPVVQHVRDGLRRGRCDWAPKLEEGMAIELPNLLAIRHVAQLMAFTAELEPDPRAAARLGLEVVAYGEDIARQRTLIAVMIGIAVKATGFESLERTLRRGAVPPEGYEEVISALATYGPTDVARGFEAERVGLQVELAHLSGRTIGGPRTDQPVASPGGMWMLTRIGPLFFEHEWSAFYDFFTRFEQLMTLPRTEREPKIAALMAEVESSWTLFASLGMPNLSASRDHADASLMVANGLRVIAAAHLHRLESGAFPADAQPLAARLGGALPTDPFRADGGPLAYAVKDGELRVWSVGKDGTDDGGHGRWFDDEKDRKDHVVVGRAPN